MWIMYYISGFLYIIFSIDNNYLKDFKNVLIILI